MPIDAISGGFAYNAQAKPVGGEERLQDRIREQKEEEKPSISETRAVENTRSEEAREVRASSQEEKTRDPDPREDRGNSVDITV